MYEILSKESKLRTLTPFLFVATILLLVMIYGRAVLIPVIIAFGIWFVLNGITDFIHKWSIAGRQMSRAWSLILGLLIMTIVFGRVAILFYEKFFEFIAQVPTYAENLSKLLESVPESVWEMIAGNESDMMTSGLDVLVNYGTDLLTGYASTLAANLINILSQTILILIYVIFLFLEQGTFTDKMKYMFVSAEQRAEFESILFSIREQIQTYTSVKTWVSLATGAVSYLVMQFMFGLDHSIIWAILIFILNFIPNFGSIIAVLFPIVMALLQFGNWFTVAALLAVLTLIQLIVGNFVEPRLMGNQLNISPFVVLIALAVFGAIWGVIGMFLSVPMTVILLIVFSHFDSTRPIAVLLSGNGIVHGVQIDVSNPQSEAVDAFN